MRRKTWILDIDGVLNPVGIKPPKHVWKGWIEHEVTDPASGKTFPVKIAEDVIEFLIEMDMRPDVQIIWHTTWQHGANDLGAKFDIPEFAVLESPQFESWNHRSSAGWWKLPAVERFLDTCDHDVLWTDDDLAVVLPKPVHSSGFTLNMIAPDQFTGLTPKHLRQIREFFDKQEVS
jgi:hypothetical protein